MLKIVPNEGDIIDHCTGLIAGYKTPASVSFLDELARNPSGKVLKNILRGRVLPGDPARR